MEAREEVVRPIADQRGEGGDRAGIIAFDFGKRLEVAKRFRGRPVGTWS